MSFADLVGGGGAGFKSGLKMNSKPTMPEMTVTMVASKAKPSALLSRRADQKEAVPEEARELEGVRGLVFSGVITQVG